MATTREGEDHLRKLGKTSLGAAAVAMMVGASTASDADQSPTWINLAPVPVANPDQGIASQPVVIGGTLYLPGGSWNIVNVGGGMYDTFFGYDIATNQWSTLPPLPENVSVNAAAAIGSVIYVIGGVNNQPCCHPTNTLFTYDTSVASWASQSMPFDSEQGCAGIINGKIYVTGPYDGNTNTFSNVFYVYDPANSSWMQLASPTYDRFLNACGVINNRFYSVSGLDPDGHVANTLESYDPGSNSWTTLAPIPTGVEHGGFAVYGNELYVIGGDTDPANWSAVNLVQVYNPQSNSWSNSFNTPFDPAVSDRYAVGTQAGIFLVGGQPMFASNVADLVKLIPPSINITQVQPPINADGSSVFNAKRGVVPVIFTLTIDGVASCDLPQATISVSKTGDGGGQVDESVYEMAADNGSYFRISNCQWVYNLNSKALGAGTYQIGLSGDGVTGTAIFKLQ